MSRLDGMNWSVWALLLATVVLSGCGADEAQETAELRAAETTLAFDALRHDFAGCYVESRQIASIVASLPADAFGELGKSGGDWHSEFSDKLAQAYQIARATEVAVSEIARSGVGIKPEDVQECASKVAIAWTILDEALGQALVRSQIVPDLSGIRTQLLVSPLIATQTSGVVVSLDDLELEPQFGVLPNAESTWGFEEVGIVARVEHVENQLIRSAYQFEVRGGDVVGPEALSRVSGVIRDFEEVDFYYTGPLYFGALVHDPAVSLNLSEYRAIEARLGEGRANGADAGGCACGTPAFGPCESPLLDMPSGLLASHALQAAMCGGAVDWEEFLDWMDVDPLGDPEYAWWTGFLAATPDWNLQLAANILVRLPSLRPVAEHEGLVVTSGLGGGSLSDFCGGGLGGLPSTAEPGFGPSLCAGCSTVLVDCTPEQDPGGETDTPTTIDTCRGGFVDLEYEGCPIRTCDPPGRLDFFNYGEYQRHVASEYGLGNGDLCLSALFGAEQTGCDPREDLEFLAELNRRLIPGPDNSPPSICADGVRPNHVSCHGPTLCSGGLAGGESQCVRCDIDGVCHRVAPPDGVNPEAGGSSQEFEPFCAEFAGGGDSGDCKFLCVAGEFNSAGTGGTCTKLIHLPSGDVVTSGLPPTWSTPAETGAEQTTDDDANDERAEAPGESAENEDDGLGDNNQRRRRPPRSNRGARDSGSNDFMGLDLPDLRQDSQRSFARAADPILLATGQLFHQQIDQVAWGTPGAWNVRALRTYNVTDEAGAMGLNWSHGFEESLEFIRRRADLANDDGAAMATVIDPYPAYCYEDGLVVNCIVRRSGDGGAALYVWSPSRYAYVSTRGDDGLLAAGVDVELDGELPDYFTNRLRCEVERNCRPADDSRVTVYRHLASNGVVTEFDHTGRVIRKTSITGEHIAYSYDPDGALRSVVDDRGKQLDFSYGINGLVQRVTDPASGNITEYCYDLHILPPGDEWDDLDGEVASFLEFVEADFTDTLRLQALGIPHLDALQITMPGGCYRLRRGTPTLAGLWVAALRASRASLDPDSAPGATPDETAEAARVQEFIRRWYDEVLPRGEDDSALSFEDFVAATLQQLDTDIAAHSTQAALVATLPPPQIGERATRAYDPRFLRRGAVLRSAITRPSTATPAGVAHAEPTGYRFEYSDVALDQDYQLAFDPNTYGEHGDVRLSSFFRRAAAENGVQVDGGGAGGDPFMCGSGLNGDLGWSIRARELYVSMGRITRLERLTTRPEQALLSDGLRGDASGARWRTTLQNAYDFNVLARDAGAETVRSVGPSFGRIVEQRYGRTRTETVDQEEAVQTPIAELSYVDESFMASELPLFSLVYLGYTNGAVHADVPAVLGELAASLFPTTIGGCDERLANPGPTLMSSTSSIPRGPFGRRLEGVTQPFEAVEELIEEGRLQRRCRANRIDQWVMTRDRDGFTRYVALSALGAELFSGAESGSSIRARATYFDGNNNVVARLDEPRLGDSRSMGGRIGEAALFGRGASLATLDRSNVKGGPIEVRELDWTNDDPRARGNVVYSRMSPGELAIPSEVDGAWRAHDAPGMDTVLPDPSSTPPSEYYATYEPLAQRLRTTRTGSSTGRRSRVVFEYELMGTGGASQVGLFLEKFGVASRALEGDVHSTLPSATIPPTAPGCIGTSTGVRPLPAMTIVDGPSDTSSYDWIHTFDCYNGWGDLVYSANGRGAHEERSYQLASNLEEGLVDRLINASEFDSSLRFSLGYGFGTGSDGGGVLTTLSARAPRAAAELEALAGIQLPMFGASTDDLGVASVTTRFDQFVGGIATVVTHDNDGEQLSTATTLDSLLRPVSWEGPGVHEAQLGEVQPYVEYGYDGAGRVVSERRYERAGGVGRYAPDDVSISSTRYFDAHGVLLGVCDQPAGSGVTCEQPIQTVAAAIGHEIQLAEQQGRLLTTSALTRLEPTLHERESRQISPAGRESRVCRDGLARITRESFGVLNGTACSISESDASAELTVRYSLDSLGRRVHTVHGSGSDAVSESLGFDGYGRVVASVRAGQPVQFMGFDAFGRTLLSGSTTVDREAVARLQLLDWGGDSFVDRVQSTWRPDPLAQMTMVSTTSTVLARDALGQPTHIRPDGNAFRDEYHEYNSVGYRVRTQAPDGSVSYDVNVTPFMQFVRHVDQAADVDVASLTHHRFSDGIVMTVAYESLERGLQQTSELDVWGRELGAFDVDGTGTELYYDGFGRPAIRTSQTERGTTSTSSEVERWSYDMDGLLVSLIDPGGAETRMGYDAAGRHSWLAVPGPNTEEVHTRVTFDSAGRVSGVSESAGEMETQWRYGYETGTANLSTVSSGDTHLFYNYDVYGGVAFGQRTQFPSGDSVESTIDRDASGRVVAEGWDLGRAGAGLAAELAPGQTIDGTYTVSRQHSDGSSFQAGLLQGVYSAQLGEQLYVEQRTRDERVAVVAFGEGEATLTRDLLGGQLRGQTLDFDLTRAGWSLHTKFDHDAAGRVTSIGYSDVAGLLFRRQRAFDSAGRPSLDHEWHAGVGGFERATGVSLDGRGRIAEWTDAWGTSQEAYAAVVAASESGTHLGAQLVEQTGVPPFEIGRNALGAVKLVQRDGDTLWVAGFGSGRVTQEVNGEALKWDDFGRLVQTSAQSTEWTSDHLVAVVKTETSEQRHYYDAFGRLVRTIEGGEVLDLVYLDQEVLEEHSGEWSRSHWLTGDLDGALGFTIRCDRELDPCDFAPEILQAQAVALGSDEHRSFATLMGHRNDVHAVVDSSGVAVERYAYDMNGDTIWQDSEGVGHWESGDFKARCRAGDTDAGCRSHYGNVRRFTGARWDPTSATYNLRARTYSPHLGLFTSRDPLGYVDSYDVWMYVGGNPFAFVDPLGMGALDDPIAQGRRMSAGDLARLMGRPGRGRFQDVMGQRSLRLLRPLTSPAEFGRDLLRSRLDRVRRRVQWMTDPGAALSETSVDLERRLNALATRWILVEDAFDGHPTAQGELAAVVLADTAEALLAGSIARMLRMPGRRGCFVAGTPVMLPEGRSLAIQEIQAGDVVRTMPDPLRSDERRSPDNRVTFDLTWFYAHFAGPRTVGVQEPTSGTAGEDVRTESGELAVLSSVRAEAGAATVYNIEVHTAESYYAGAQGAEEQRSLATVVNLTTAQQMATHRVADGVTLETLDGVVVGVGGTAARDYRAVIGSRYVPGDLHATDVTPELWRRLVLELRQPDGARAEIVVLRPLWWIQQTGAVEGGIVDLEVTEAGLAGIASVVSLTDDVAVDSREDGVGSNLVIGTIQHHNARVLSLVFDGDRTAPLGVTPSHPLFSADREEYVAAGELELGERVRTAGEELAVLTEQNERTGTAAVYNLEVHRAESYFVGEQQLLAHNTGIDCLPRLPRNLRNKIRRINNEATAGGNRGVSGSVSRTDARRLGEHFVGPGYRETSVGFMSADGLRQFRFPSQKFGTDPNTGAPWSRTGWQSNFETRPSPSGPWQSNVHLDVRP